MDLVDFDRFGWIFDGFGSILMDFDRFWWISKDFDGF